MRTLATIRVMTTYIRKPQEVTYVQYNGDGDWPLLTALGADVMNDYNNLPIVRVGPGDSVEDGAYKEVQVGWYVLKTTNEFDQHRFDTMSADEFASRFDEVA